MPLSPAPLLPGMSPLPDPRGRPPSRRALRIGALAALPTLIALLALGQLFQTQLLFLAPGFQSRAGGGGSNGDATTANGSTFQGFVYMWSRNLVKNAPQGSGFSQPASFQNMQSEANNFHMNAVIIPIVADMTYRSESPLYWHSSDKGNVSTLADADYVDAIHDALKAHLVPILELQVRQHDPASGGDDSASLVGAAWSTLQSYVPIGTSGGGSVKVGHLEQDWFDNYTAFVVHYAQMSQQYHLPYFIIGDELANTTVDTTYTSRKGDPQGIINVPGDPPCPGTAGRHECEWRHVIHALKSPGYASIDGHKSQVGGGYSGKLIYGAYWNKPGSGAQVSEFDHIGWWDVVDYIGVDAYFPLTQGLADVGVQDLENSWNGKFNPSGNQGDIVDRLQKLVDTFDRPIVFTAAGYNSAAGANAGVGGIVDSTRDDAEQLNDMEALLLTFTSESWWTGAFWYADEPIVPRESQPNWASSTAWAGNTLQSSKEAGQWLASYYQSNSLPCPSCGLASAPPPFRSSSAESADANARASGSPTHTRRTMPRASTSTTVGK